MDLGFIFTSLALLLLVAAFVARPLIEKLTGTGDADKTPIDDLISQREAILIELRDVDFDHTTGKMNDDDYKEQRARLIAKGVEVLRALDAQQAPAAADDTEEDEIEALIAQKRGKKIAANTEDEAESLIAMKRGQKVVKPLPANGHDTETTTDTLFCTQCGAPAHAGDKFCAKCGANLQKVWQD